jgi:adenosine deaminase
MESVNRDWLAKLPKVELHVHLEGSIPIRALWHLMEKYGGDPEVPTQDALEKKFEFRDFPHFIETWVWKNNFIKEYEDLSFIAEAVARDWAAQNIRYSEVFCSPGDFKRHGLETQKIIEAIRAGLNAVPEIRVNIVADLIRDFGPEVAAVVLEDVHEVRGFGVIGVGIGGSEQSFPPEPFELVYERARELGFKTSAHAGEVAGPESIWGAIRTLKVDRIGHGTRAIEDESLVEHLAEHQIPLELNPISNVKTGVIDSISEHPVRRYFDRGIPISINSDDPKMFGNSLADEYESLQLYHGFSDEEVQRVILLGIETSWLSEESKETLRHTFKVDDAWRNS